MQKFVRDCGLKQSSLSAHQVSAIRARVQCHRPWLAPFPPEYRRLNRKAAQILLSRIAAFNKPENPKGLGSGYRRPGSLSYR